jgi:hypothetical protein
VYSRKQIRRCLITGYHDTSHDGYRGGQSDIYPPPTPPKLSGQALPLKAGQALQRGIHPYEPHEKRETNNEKRFYLISPISNLHACNAWLQAHGDSEVACYLGEGIENQCEKI